MYCRRAERRAVSAMETLEQCLTTFSQKVNQNTRLKGVLRGWDRVLQIEAVDTQQEKFVMEFRDASIVSLARGSVESAPIVMRAEEQLLREIFAGDTNPAIAFLDGTLQIFANDRDQVKLEAISLLIWD
jgi:hypothetical protein